MGQHIWKISNKSSMANDTFRVIPSSSEWKHEVFQDPPPPSPMGHSFPTGHQMLVLEVLHFHLIKGGGHHIRGTLALFLKLIWMKSRKEVAKCPSFGINPTHGPTLSHPKSTSSMAGL